MSTDDAMTTGTVQPSIEARLARAGLPPLLRQAWLEVDLDALAGNARALRTLVPDGTRLGIVVKADGYGHGLEAAARAAVRGGADLLLVATLDEALALRGFDFGGRVLVLYPIPSGSIGAAVAADLELVVADDASVEVMAAWLRTSGRSAAASAGRSATASPTPRVHLGIDSGMGRGGLAPSEAGSAARRLLDAGLSSLAGTWSHLASPEDRAVAAGQVERFEAALRALGAAGIHPGERHLDATGGLLSGGGPAYDLVRIGLAFFGLVQPELTIPEAPPELRRVADGLRPALALRGRATTITTIPAGSSVGYAGTWTAGRESVVATIPVGYADGWARAYSPGSWALARGMPIPVIGRVSSDALALDVTDVAGFGPEDEVTMIGVQAAADGADTAGPADPAAPAGANAAPMTVHDLATLRGSIAWEVLDSFSPRLSRVYLERGQVVGVRHLDGVTRFVGR